MQVNPLSDKIVCRQGSHGAGLKASQQEMTEGSTLSSHVMFACFLIMLVMYFSLSDYEIFFCGEHEILPSFHESIFINN